MFDQLVGQFLQSGAGKDVLTQLGQKGIEGPAAQAALTATAEGAAQQAGGAGGIAGLLGGLVGGSGGGAAGAVAGLLGGSGAAAAPGAGGGMLAAMTGPVAQFVAQKTGLAPAMAQTVVGIALPKLLELIQGQGASAAQAPTAQAPAQGGAGDLLGALGGLLK